MDQDDLFLENSWRIWPVDLDGNLLHLRSNSVHFLLLFAALVVLPLLLHRWRRSLAIDLHGWRSSKLAILLTTVHFPILNIPRVPVRTTLQRSNLRSKTHQRLRPIRSCNSFQPANRGLLPLGPMVLNHLFTQHSHDQLHCRRDHQFLRTSQEQTKNHFL